MDYISAESEMIAPKERKGEQRERAALDGTQKVITARNVRPNS
jgi:hypothetical protein